MNGDNEYYDSSSPIESEKSVTLSDLEAQLDPEDPLQQQALQQIASIRQRQAEAVLEDAETLADQVLQNTLQLNAAAAELLGMDIGEPESEDQLTDEEDGI